jgi:hypothetical protein
MLLAGAALTLKTALNTARELSRTRRIHEDTVLASEEAATAFVPRRPRWVSRVF